MFVYHLNIPVHTLWRMTATKKSEYTTSIVKMIGNMIVYSMQIIESENCTKPSASWMVSDFPAAQILLHMFFFRMYCIYQVITLKHFLAAPLGNCQTLLLPVWR